MKLDPCHHLPRKVTHLMNSTVQPARHPKNPRGIRAFQQHIWADILGTHGKSPETCNLNPEDRAENLGIHNNFLQPQGLQRQRECGQPAGIYIQNSAASSSFKSRQQASTTRKV